MTDIPRTTHTPGPWHDEVVEFAGGRPDYWVIRSPDATRVADVFCAGALLDAEALANTRLIASAPELLDACRIALEALAFLHHDQSNWYDAIRAAVAKATGEMAS